jgi:tyrosyl-tRNA synthetase
LPRYFALTTGWDPDRVDAEVAALAAGRTPPVAAKRLLARTVVDLYHGEGAGQTAEAEFDRVFRSHEAPADVPVFTLEDGHLVDGRIRLFRLLALAGLVASNSEGRRKIAEGAVRIDGERVSDPEADLAPDDVDGKLLQVGRRAWARIESQS